MAPHSYPPARRHPRELGTTLCPTPTALRGDAAAASPVAAEALSLYLAVTFRLCPASMAARDPRIQKATAVPSSIGYAIHLTNNRLGPANMTVDGALMGADAAATVAAAAVSNIIVAAAGTTAPGAAASGEGCLHGQGPRGPQPTACGGSAVVSAFPPQTAPITTRSLAFADRTA
eukprot:jgi/Ulvmu1/10088/UM006_0035.1